MAPNKFFALKKRLQNLSGTSRIFLFFKKSMKHGRRNLIRNNDHSRSDGGNSEHIELIKSGQNL